MKKTLSLLILVLSFMKGMNQNIEFTQIPTWGTTENLKGLVHNTAIGDNKILVYLYFEGFWWVKPYGTSPFTIIQPDSTWECDVTTGGCDIYAVRYTAFIVPSGFTIPGTSFQNSLPVSLYSYPNVQYCRVPGNQNLFFSGYNWIVKQSECLMGPESNYWTDDEDDVFVDEEGNLNLKMVYKNNKWYGSEIIGDTALGYGEYSFTIQSVQNFTLNSVLGFFTWDEYATNNHYREIDMEYSHWGISDDENFQFVIQPYSTPGNLYKFPIPAIENTIHKFVWKYDTVEFASLNSDSSTIESWIYTGSDFSIPSSTANPRINLWKFQQNPTQNVTVKISEFEFKNLLDSPVGVVASKGTYADKIEISWNEVPGAQYYGIFRHPHNDPLKAELLTENWTEATSYEDTDVEPGIIYYYFIRCSDNLAGSNISGYASGFSKTVPGWVTNIELLDASVFLEGCFNGITMNYSLNSSGYLPLTQPYIADPWNYTGDESVLAIPSANIVDWILLEIRSTAEDAVSATESTIIVRKAAFLHDAGEITGVDGSSLPVFNVPVSENLFLVVHHRNHCEIMSSLPLIESSGVLLFDFTNSANAAYGGSLAQKQLATGIYGMVAGDGVHDSQINNKDKDDEWINNSGNYGYYLGDFNLDGQVNNLDLENIWKSNAGLGSQVPK